MLRAPVPHCVIRTQLRRAPSQGRPRPSATRLGPKERPFRKDAELAPVNILVSTAAMKNGEWPSVHWLFLGWKWASQATAPSPGPERDRYSTRILNSPAGMDTADGGVEIENGSRLFRVQ